MPFLQDSLRFHGHHCVFAIPKIPCLRSPGRNAVSARQTHGATHHSTRLSFTRVDQFFSVHDKLSQVYYHLIWFQACTTLRLSYHLPYCAIQSPVFAFLFCEYLDRKVFIVLAGYFSVFSFWVMITPRWVFLCCVIYRWRICLRWRGVEWARIGEVLVLCFSVACSASAWCMSFITWSNLRDIYWTVGTIKETWRVLSRTFCVWTIDGFEDLFFSWSSSGYSAIQAFAYEV